MPYILLIIYLLLSLFLQIFAGNFPTYIMAFPLNLLCATLFYWAMLMLWCRRRQSTFVRFMLSPQATFIALFLLIDACAVIGLTGEMDMTISWPFIAVLLYFQTVLIFVLLRGLREVLPTGAQTGPIRWRFILNHAGLLLALAAGFWGAPDSRNLRLRAYEGEPVTQALLQGSGPVGIGHEIELKKFTIERFDNGTPSLYEAELLIDGIEANIRVNHPYRLGFGKNLYLTGYNLDSDKGRACCIMQMVIEPWKPWALAGILMMLSGAFLLFTQGPRKKKSSAIL